MDYRVGPLYYRPQPDLLPMFPPNNPPRWLVRLLRAVIVGLPLSCLLLVGLLATSADRRRLDLRLRTTTPTSYEEYVEKNGLCRGTTEAINGTNATLHEQKIREACVTLRRWEREFYVKRDHVVHPFDFRYKIAGESVCDARTDVIVIVHSYQPYESRRKAIRETWGGAVVNDTWPGRAVRMRVRVVFMFGERADRVGNPVLWRESQRHGDVVQGNFLDSYKNMTLKSLFGLKWVAEHCPSARYLVKSDDDMIINFPHLISVLQQTDMTWAIMGPLNFGAKVYRKVSKWAIPREKFPFYYYPPYESGACYVISADLVRPLFDTAQYVPRIFIDDVYITGILGKILGVRHIRQSGFAFWVSKTPHACDVIQDKVITATKMKPELMRTLWKDISNHNVKCAI